MKTLPCLLALGFTAICATAFAQTPSDSMAPPPLPPGPLIQKRAPDFAHWVITSAPTPAKGANSPSTPTADASAVNGPQSEVTMTKTGKIMLREVRTQDGRVVPIWCVGGLQITLFGNSSIVQAKNPDPRVPTPNYEDYSDSDFQGFDWIALSKYTGIEESGGRKCIVFQDTVKNDIGSAIDRSAYIDFATRLPVALIVGGGTRTYVFKPPPTTPLTLPPPVVQLLKNRQAEMNSATPRSQAP
jgi:hypothetical protein